ncbi:LLM class flavin-dependent oxidoreductase [Deinococcus budaensis]|uniref:Luciferase family oxidoreductase group 1 n=1 Tax=Deinococcus budaensis TaxID=1665626 RepID=A0A7W8GDK4_9DEIO|nr:LLM class flavin-dependent oxidoreductase [Deinococcus budaensis]MBB5233459.1 luciferase family oxidoreductase group 1 [Deinococcus budaensis]
MTASPSPLPLSVLDLVPVPRGSDAPAALRETVALAQETERLGYTRFWVAEHHNMGALAASVPAVVLAALSQHTSRLRLGAGGVMLPNHAPLAVAESYRLLSALAPGRVDLGLGRAPGTDGRTALALRGAAGLHEAPFEAQLDDLLAFGHGIFPAGHPFAGVTAAPADTAGRPPLFPPLWVLSSSGYGARVAAGRGLGLAFAAHINPRLEDAAAAVQAYRAAFRPSAAFPEPRSLVAASVVCAPTAEEAEDLAAPLGLMFLRLIRGETAPFPSVAEARAYPYTPHERAQVAASRARVIVGDPAGVREELLALAGRTGADELMLTTLLPDPAARRRSYRLVAEALGLGGPGPGAATEGALFSPGAAPSGG